MYSFSIIADKNETSIDNGTNASTGNERKEENSKKISFSLVSFYNTISTLLSSTVTSTKVRVITSPFILPITPIRPKGNRQFTKISYNSVAGDFSYFLF